MSYACSGHLWTHHVTLIGGARLLRIAHGFIMTMTVPILKYMYSTLIMNTLNKITMYKNHLFKIHNNLSDRYMHIYWLFHHLLSIVNCFYSIVQCWNDVVSFCQRFVFFVIGLSEIYYLTPSVGRDRDTEQWQGRTLLAFLTTHGIVILNSDRGEHC